MKRREFIERSLASAGAVALGGVLPAGAAVVRPKTATEWGAAREDGFADPFLGIGTGRWNQSSFEPDPDRADAFNRLIRHAYDRGVRYIDAADAYGSHAYVKEAIKGLPREAFYIQTKIINRSAVEAKADLDRFRQEMGTDYFDSVLVHVVTQPTWLDDFKGVRDVLSDAKAKKVVRAHGVACHSLGALKAAAEIRGSRSIWRG